jgi:hypothetical protein
MVLIIKASLSNSIFFSSFKPVTFNIDIQHAYFCLVILHWLRMSVNLMCLNHTFGNNCMHSAVTPLKEDTVYVIFKRKDVETEKGGKQLEGRVQRDKAG